MTWLLTKQHVLRPSRPANEYGLTIDFEETEPLICQFGSHFAYAEGDRLLIGDLAVLFKDNGCGLQMRRSHLVRPPERRVFDMEFGVIRGIEDDRPVFASL